MMEHPTKIVRRICEQKDMKPEVVLGCVLAMLGRSHLFTALQSREGDARPDVFSEIMGHLQIWRPPKATPPSMLATLESMAQIDHQLAGMNVEPHKKAGDEAGAANQAMMARAFEVFRLACKEVMNTAEHSGIQSQIQIDEMHERGEWPFGPHGAPDQTPPNDPEKPT